MSAAARSRAMLVLALTLALVGTVGCAGRKKRQAELAKITTLAADEGYRLGMEHLSRRELRQAKATLERIQYAVSGPSRQEVEPLVRLAIADVTYWQGAGLNLIDARNLYLDFVTLNASHPLAPYAQLQAGVCSLRQVNHPTQDQTQTLQAISDLEVVRARFPASRYVGAAEQMLRDARGRMAEHEYLVGRFYLKKKVYKAAKSRFLRLLEDYPSYEPRDEVFYYLGQAYLRNKEAEEGRRILDRLLADYPEGRYVELARKALSMAPPAAEPAPPPADLPGSP